MDAVDVQAIGNGGEDRRMSDYALRLGCVSIVGVGVQAVRALGA
jgi:hypothetical protein